MDTSNKGTDSLIAIGVTVTGLVILKTYLSERVYRKRILEHLNSFSYFNLLIFCLARLYCQKAIQCQILTAKVSMTVTFLVFLGIILYHVLSFLSDTKYGRHSIATIRHKMKETKLVLKLADCVNINLSHHHDSETEVPERVTSAPSSSVVGLSPQHPSANEEDELKGEERPEEAHPTSNHFLSFASLRLAWKLPKKASKDTGSGKFSTSLREALLEENS